MSFTSDSPGILCPYCQKTTDSSVLETRADRNNTKIRRRRQCFSCHERFTTYEQVGVDLETLKKTKQLAESLDIFLVDISDLAHKLRRSIE